MTIHYTTLVPSATALVSGVATAVVQVATHQPTINPLCTMLIPIVSAAIGGAVSYGILKGTVQAVKESHASMAQSIQHIDRNVTNLVGRVSNIEGRIGRRRNDPHLDFDE